MSLPTMLCLLLALYIQQTKKQTSINNKKTDFNKQQKNRLQ